MYSRNEFPDRSDAHLIQDKQTCELLFLNRFDKTVNSKYDLFSITLHFRAVVSGGAWGSLASPEFGSSVNPIPTGGGRLCPPHYC